jgi:hypothetical protein
LAQRKKKENKMPHIDRVKTFIGQEIKAIEKKMRKIRDQGERADKIAQGEFFDLKAERDVLHKMEEVCLSDF